MWLLVIVPVQVLQHDLDWRREYCVVWKRSVSVQCTCSGLQVSLSLLPLPVVTQCVLLAAVEAARELTGSQDVSLFEYCSMLRLPQGHPSFI